MSKTTDIKVRVGIYHQILHQLRLRHFPSVLCNSFQKSGTHLLVGAVSHLSPFRNYGRKAYWHFLSRARVATDKNSTGSDVKNRLRQGLPGEIFRGHIAANPEIEGFLVQHHWKHIFIYRDLRDVVMSLFFGWKNKGGIDSWPYRYFQSLKSDEERVTFIISGWPQDLRKEGFPAQIDYPDIGKRFVENLPWLSSPHVLAIRFEALAKPETRIQLLENIGHYILGEVFQRTQPEAIHAMESGCNPAHSKTYRKGTGGEWKHHFTPLQKKMFKDCAGHILIDLGYETDCDW